MRWIITNQDLQANKKLVKQFFELYVDPRNFPDKDEREEPDIIQERIRTSSPNPHTHLAIATTPQEEVIGGAIVELYPQSQCVLLTYLFVNPDLRKTGIARKIIQDEEGLQKGIQLFENQYNTKVKAVFFETNNPLKTTKDSLSPADRLKVFTKLGAKWVDIPYVQPPLDADKAPVDNLHLCTFPTFNNDNILLENQTITTFLEEFYQSLEASETFVKENLAKINKKLTDTEYLHSKCIYLKELPKIEEPKLFFGRASVCFHILVDESNNKPQHLKESNHKSYCTVFHSFETDLFSYRFQNETPPYFTKSFDSLQTESLIIRFPQLTQYTTEGRQETLYVLEKESDETTEDSLARGREVEVGVFLNFSYFPESEIRIWHLVFTSLSPQKQAASAAVIKGFLTEYDIIRLMKFFSGAQERQADDKEDQLKKIHFLLDNQSLTLDALLPKLSGVVYEKENPTLKSIISGVVQVDTDFGWFVQNGKLQSLKISETNQSEISGNVKEIFRYLKSAHNEEIISENELEDFYKTNPNAEYIFESFCGITLGIFDFTRMGYEEVIDTLIPRSATKSSFLSVNRGVLSSFGRNDELMATTWNTIGMSPYLIIPSAVLAHNNHIVSTAENTLSRTLRKYEIKGTEDKLTAYLGRKSKGMKSIRLEISELEKTRKEIEELINTDYLPNVFQYPTEQDLYEYGLKHRGITDKINTVRAKLGQLHSMIEDRKNSLNDIYQFWVQFLLGVVSLFQIESVFQSIAELMADSNHVVHLTNAVKFSYIALGWFLFSFPLIFFIWYILKIRPKINET